MKNQTKLRAVGLCSGIEGFELAAEDNGVEVTATAEVNEDAKLVSFLNNGRKSLGDIRKINGADLGKFDLLLAGSSCKGWSQIGNQLGFAHSEGDILLHCIRIAKEANAKVILTENVPAIVSHSQGKSLEIINEFLVECGFTPFEGRVLNSAHWGLSTARKRWFACSFRKDVKHLPLVWPDFKKPPRHIRADLLPEEEVKDLYVDDSEFVKADRKRPVDPYSSLMLGYVRKQFRERMVWSIDALAPTFMAAIGGPGGPSGLFQMDDGRIRNLAPSEMLASMGFPKNYRIPFHGFRGGRLVGNALCPPVAKSVVSMVIKSLNGQGVAK